MSSMLGGEGELKNETDQLSSAVLGDLPDSRREVVVGLKRLVHREREGRKGEIDVERRRFHGEEEGRVVKVLVGTPLIDLERELLARTETPGGLGCSLRLHVSARRSRDGSEDSRVLEGLQSAHSSVKTFDNAEEVATGDERCAEDVKGDEGGVAGGHRKPVEALRNETSLQEGSHDEIPHPVGVTSVLESARKKGEGGVACSGEEEDERSDDGHLSNGESRMKMTARKEGILCACSTVLPGEILGDSPTPCEIKCVSSRRSSGWAGGNSQAARSSLRSSTIACATVGDSFSVPGL